MSARLRQDLLLRAAGVLLLLTAVACLVRVFHDPAALQGKVGWLDGIEAAYSFLGCSAGAVLAVLGRHIHDPIAVSGRWATIARDRQRH